MFVGVKVELSDLLVFAANPAGCLEDAEVSSDFEMWIELAASSGIVRMGFDWQEFSERWVVNAKERVFVKLG